MPIEEICIRRGITDVMHFIQLSNLNSILQNGICTREYLYRHDIQFDYNDDLRIDGFENSISFSISFPNYRMFYRLRQENNCNWIVLICNAQILGTFNCIFCYTNAADTRILLDDHNRLRSDTAFEEMFSERHGSRDNLDDDDPTDVQAEVLCLENVSTDYIRAIVFDDEQELARFNQLRPKINLMYHPPGQGVFASREYWAEWCRRHGI